MPRQISINRAPVLILWAAVVAQRLGFDEDEALTLGEAVAGKCDTRRTANSDPTLSRSPLANSGRFPVGGKQERKCEIG